MEYEPQPSENILKVAEESQPKMPPNPDPKKLKNMLIVDFENSSTGDLDNEPRLVALNPRQFICSKFGIFKNHRSIADVRFFNFTGVDDLERLDLEEIDQVFNNLKLQLKLLQTITGLVLNIPTLASFSKNQHYFLQRIMEFFQLKRPVERPELIVMAPDLETTGRGEHPLLSYMASLRSYGVHFGDEKKVFLLTNCDKESFKSINLSEDHRIFKLIQNFRDFDVNRKYEDDESSEEEEDSESRPSNPRRGRARAAPRF